MTANLHGITTQKAGKVLAVICDPELIRILEANLTHVNLEVISAQSGAEALSKVYTEKPDIILLDPALPDIDGIEVCQQLKESPQTSHIPVILISGRTRRRSKTGRAANGANHQITKPFDPKEVVALVLAYLKRKERAENIDPLTGLPNQIQVSKELTGLIEQKKIFAAIYITMDDLRAFNKAYGFAQGDRTIRTLADIVCEAVRLFGNPDDLTGHLGGDKFVVVSTPWKARSLCRRIIADFNNRIKSLYTDEHLQRGYIEYEGRLGEKEQSPIMSLHVAVVTNQRRTFYHHLEVSEAAAEQLDYLKRFQGSNCYFDLPASGIEPALAVARRGVSYAQREEIKALHGVLDWLTFLVSELNVPINIIKDCLDSVESIPVDNLTHEQWNSIKTARENFSQIFRVMEGLTNLTGDESLMASTVFDEVDFGSTFNWVMEQVQELAEQRKIETDIEGIEDIGRLIADRRNLTQSLLYLLRSEIQASQTGSRLHIHAAEMGEDLISIQITNPDRYIPQRRLAMLLQGQPEGVPQDALMNELYPAKLLVQGLGGKLNITSERGKGVTYTVTLPKKWQSWMQEVNALQLATEISRKEARAELRNIQNLLLSLVEKVPPAMEDSIEKLRGKVQELGVLCNRSLFLTDDLSSRLETQQDRVLQQEVEQIATSEAMLLISREIARSMHVAYLFDSDSAKRVAKYALTIANEFRLSEGDRQALHHAALLKDLGLALSGHDMVEQMVVPTLEEAMTIRARFNMLWKVLSTLPFLSLALVFVLYRYERYDGTGGSLGIKGDKIPLGARILAVVDAFDAMTSGLWPQGTVTPRQAIQKIADNAGQRFDPDVVSAFLRAWRMKKLGLTLSES